MAVRAYHGKVCPFLCAMRLCTHAFGGFFPRSNPTTERGSFQRVRRMGATQVIDHYENPRNVGSLDKNDFSVGTAVVGAPACGDVMKLQIKVGGVRGLQPR